MSSISAQFAEGLLPEPGIFRNNTAYYSGYKWVDADKVRFSSDVPEKIGGWVKELVSGTFLGVPRRTLSWSAIDSTQYLVTATHLFLYVKAGGVYYNITPFRATSVLTDPLALVDGDDLVYITDSAHGARVGDYICIDPAVVLSGTNLYGDYIVESIIDSDTYTIRSGVVRPPASSFLLESGDFLLLEDGDNLLVSQPLTGGGTVTIKYYLEAGLADSGVSGYGWGVGEYGEEAYGTARTEGFKSDARNWCLANWGEDVLSLPIGGKLYYWDTSVGPSSPAIHVTTAPARSNYMIVASKFRQVILFGTETISSVFDPMLIRWSSAEDYTDFTPTTLNSAGEYRLSEGNKIVGAVETKGGEIIVFTDTAAYRMRPVTTDDVYSVELIGKSCGLLSPHAHSDVDGTVYWMSQSSIKVYTGQVRTLPSSMEDYVFDNRSEGKYNDEQKVKFFVGNNGDFNEIWFFYATKNSIENDRYFIYNYGNNTFYDGALERTAWSDKAIIERPVGYNRAGTLYIHENGINDDAQPMRAYVTLGDIDISEGNQIMFIDRYMPDGDFVGSIQLDLVAKRSSQSPVPITKTYNFVTPTEFVRVRARGRLMSCTLTTNEYNGDFKLGKLKFAIKPDGGR